MAHVAIDLFKMPEVQYEGKSYDTIIACVDRHSGWIVAVPEKQKGLKGSTVAKKMLEAQWRPFGVPSVVSSDQG